MPSKLAEQSVLRHGGLGGQDFSSACHYAWGWQDRDGSADSTVAMQFAECWSLYRKLYGMEASTHMMPMRDAWETFTATRAIPVDTYRGDWVIVPDGLDVKILPVPSVRNY